jgi:basic membrane protein A
MASTSGTIGFVGGMDIPIIRRFLCGYKQGARRGRSGCDRSLQHGRRHAGRLHRSRCAAAELAHHQIKRGADVIIQAAGGTGIGVLQAVADAGVLGIGTDSNQNGLHPGRILTSIRKRVDNAVYDSFKAAASGTFEPGIQVLGLAEGGMDWVLDDNNKDLVTPEMKAAAEAAVAGISDGSIKVHDVVADGACPF